MPIYDIRYAVFYVRVVKSRSDSKMCAVVLNLYINYLVKANVFSGQLSLAQTLGRSSLGTQKPQPMWRESGNEQHGRRLPPVAGIRSDVIRFKIWRGSLARDLSGAYRNFHQTTYYHRW